MLYYKLYKQYTLAQRSIKQEVYMVFYKSIHVSAEHTMLNDGQLSVSQTPFSFIVSYQAEWVSFSMITYIALIHLNVKNV
jgi:hypothetical protein